MSEFKSKWARREERRAEREKQRSEEDAALNKQREELAALLEIDIETKGLARAIVDFVEDRR
jgi:hypothetical protein